MQQIRAFLKNNKGATAIEYGLIAALIAIAAMGAMTQLGNGIKDTFGITATKLTTSARTAPTNGATS
ncbi:Flp family type IVb pilin [uncultured Sphingomonas sp.]|uniref:Flp family type IVb pilin n=1 Tax=uncultured Sphingomonas sp. TaxID=158754 RepID=UPI0025E1F6E6|nr:Flp family type IVb pilin [uncultured Sphingomonas sp.]